MKDYSTFTNCESCPYRNQKRKIVSVGNPNTCRYVLISEAPGRDDMRTGKPFQGEQGRLLSAFFALEHWDIHNTDDFYLMYAMSCMVTNKSRASTAVLCCRNRVRQELEDIVTVNPTVTIAVLGKNTRDSLFPGITTGILGSRGWQKYRGKDVFVTVHPSYYLYNPDQAPMLVKDVNRICRGKLPQIGPFVIEDVPYEPSDSQYPKWPVIETKSLEQLWLQPRGTFDNEYFAVPLDTHDKLEAFISALELKPRSERGFIAYDLETDQVDFMRDRILCMSLSLNEGTAWIIPDSLLYKDGRNFVTTNWDKKKWIKFMKDDRYKTASWLKPDPITVGLLKCLWALNGYSFAAHNSKFDMRFLYNHGVTNVRTDYDTIVAHYTLDERMGGHALKPLSDDYFDVGDYESELFDYITKKSAHYSRIPRSVLYKYNAMDTECTLRLAKATKEELIEDGLYHKPFLFPMMEALPMLFRAEILGVNINWDEVHRIEYEELGPAIEEIKEELRDISGYPDLNPLSSKRVNDILYDDLNMPIVEARTRAGGHKVTGRSSQRAIMDLWADMWEKGELDVDEEAWLFVEKLREYRHLRKLMGSYIRKWQLYRGTDDHVHTSFLLRGTTTGRLSAKDPPVQTIPSKVTDHFGPLVANIHIPPPGYSFVYADFSQAELMAAAGLSNDRFMIRSFQNENADYHDQVSQAAFGDSSADHRVMSKRITFGWLFGGNVEEIATKALQVDSNIGKRFADEWEKRFAGFVAWRSAQRRKMLTEGYVESLTGRRRRQLLILDSNKGKAGRIAINSPIQSLVSDFNLIAATRLYQLYKDVDWADVILLIHDSLIMQVRDDKVEEVRKIMRETMLQVPKEYFPDIPFKADTKVAKRLGDIT